MKIIVGLGNPEGDYSKTRHNMGFNVINALAQDYEIDVSKSNFDAEFGSGIIENQKVILVKPQTFMNLSGKSVLQFVNFYKIQLEDLIIIYDDVDIEISKIRIRKNGSPGSHNGMKSVTEELNSEDFPRIRVGIGKPEDGEDMISYVIGAIKEEDKEGLDKGVEKAFEAVVIALRENIDIAMNRLN